MNSTKSKSKLHSIGLQFFAEPAGDGGTLSAGEPPETKTDLPDGVGTQDDPAGDAEKQNDEISKIAEQLKQLQDQLSQEKKKSDLLAKENAEKKRQLRSMQSAEEIKAAEEKERQEAIENELKELRKQSAVATVAKRIITFVGDETVSTSIAEALYGADDIDLAIDEINKAWMAKEKQLKLEYGKIPAPSAGNPEEEKKRRDIELGKKIGQSKANSRANVDNGLKRFTI